LLSFLPDEEIAQVLAIRDYSAAPYLLLATKRGLVKKTALPVYDSPRQAGIIAVNFREEDDELIGAELCSADDEVLLISRKGLSIRFPADDSELRPMGRATSGVTGMKFRPGDELLSMSVIRARASDDERFVFTVTDGGFAKRTHVFEYRQQGRGGLGIKAMKLNEDRGSLVGGLVVTDNDEVIAIKASGQITRSAVAEVPVKGRDTMGVRFVGVAENDSVVVIALNPETTAEAARLADEAPAGDDSNSTSSEVEDDSSLESALEVRPVTPNGVSDDDGVQEDDSE
jgi:DNA gyrase subunit A